MAPAAKTEVDTTSVDKMVEGIIQEKKWTDIQLLNVDLAQILDFIG
jgi:hypothetical protein